MEEKWLEIMGEFEFPNSKLVVNHDSRPGKIIYQFDEFSKKDESKPQPLYLEEELVPSQFFGLKEYTQLRR